MEFALLPLDRSSASKAPPPTAARKTSAYGSAIICMQSEELRAGSPSGDRVEPPGDIVARPNRLLSVSMVQVTGCMDQPVTDLVVRPAKAIPETRIVLDQLAGRDRRHQVIQPLLGAPNPAKLLLNLC